MVDLLERFEVMIQQELTTYRTEDYMDPDYQRKISTISDADFFGLNGPPQTNSSSTSEINDVWREKICDWSYQVIDHFDFSREVVSISIHYLDRYLSKRPVNKKVFQLAAMTTLFMAIKLFEPGRLSMASMIDLSRGFFTIEQMMAMELSILRSLGWQVHPPTSYCFCKHILLLLPSKILSPEVRHDILELSRFLTELSVIDYFFVVHRPSIVAYAAVLTAMEEVPRATLAINDFTMEIQSVIPHLYLDDSDLAECRNRLRLLYAQGSYSRPVSVMPQNTSREESVSPVCVSYGCSNPNYTGDSYREHRGEY